MYFNSDSKEYIKVEQQSKSTEETNEQIKDELMILPTGLADQNEKIIKNETFEKWTQKSKEIDQSSFTVQKQIIQKDVVSYKKIIEKSNKQSNRRRESKTVRRTQKLLGLNSKTATLVKNGKLKISQSNLADKPIESSNIGNKMLKMMGYKEGEGLGKKSDGIVEPIKVQMRDTTKGIGYQQNYSKITDTKRQKIQMKTKERYDSLK